MVSQSNNLVVSALRAAHAMRAQYAHFDLHYTDTEREVLNATQFNRPLFFDNLGSFDDFDRKLSCLFTQTGSSKTHADKAADIVSSRIRSCQDGFNAESGWTHIRTFAATDIFDTPRWHTDGYYAQRPYQREGKVIFSPVGNTTLFHKLTRDAHTAFLEFQRSFPTQDEVNAYLGDIKAETAPAGHGSLFQVGSEDAALHSEAPIGNGRLVVTYIPGTHAQIRALAERYNQPFYGPA